MKLHTRNTFDHVKVMSFCIQGNEYRQVIDPHGNMYEMRRYQDKDVDFF